MKVGTISRNYRIFSAVVLVFTAIVSSQMTSCSPRKPALLQNVYCRNDGNYFSLNGERIMAATADING